MSDEATYRIDVTYAPGNTDERTGLTPDIAEPGAQAFLRDLFSQEGRGVARIVIEVERPPCQAVIHHGPGHQSTTRCMVKGQHAIHEACYGPDFQLARWQGDSVSTGFFDEPPDDPDE